MSNDCLSRLLLLSGDESCGRRRRVFAYPGGQTQQKGVERARSPTAPSRPRRKAVHRARPSTVQHRSRRMLNAPSRPRRQAVHGTRPSTARRQARCNTVHGARPSTARGQARCKTVHGARLSALQNRNVSLSTAVTNSRSLGRQENCRKNATQVCHMHGIAHSILRT